MNCLPQRSQVRRYTINIQSLGIQCDTINKTDARAQKIDEYSQLYRLPHNKNKQKIQQWTTFIKLALKFKRSWDDAIVLLPLQRCIYANLKVPQNQ